MLNLFDIGLVNWLLGRLMFINTFLVFDLGLPVWVASILCGVVVALFFYCLIDLFQHRDKGMAAFVWLMVVLLVPLGTFVYLIFGSPKLHRTPAPQPQYVKPGVSGGSGQLSREAPRRYFMGTTTALGGAVAIIAVVAGCAVLAFFILILIAYIQCINDPKCM
jgi:hypothetical protein